MKSVGLILALVLSLQIRANSMCEPGFIHCGDTGTNSLSWVDCLTDDGRYVDSYQVELAAGTVVRLMAFADRATDELRVSVVDGDRNIMLAEAAGTGGASLVLTVPENVPVLGIDISAPKDAHASYRLRMTCEQADGSSCQPTTLSCGAVVHGELSTSDCPTTSSYEDHYEVALRAGETIELHAVAAFGLTLEIGRRDERGTYEGVVRSGESDATLRFTADESGVYEVRIGSAQQLAPGAYELGVSCLASTRRRGVRH